MAKKMVLANNPLLSGPGLKQREDGSSPYREVAISAIDRDANQPRVNFEETALSELAESIREYGVMTPIVVRPGKLPGKYLLVMGERRLRASKLAGLTTIPAMIDSDKDESGERTLAKQLVENMQRADLTPLERSHAIGALKESFGLSIRDVANRLGVSKGLVQRSLEILELPDDLLNALREGASESKVLAISKIKDPKERAELLARMDDITRDSLVAKVESKTPSKSKKAKKKGGLSAEDQRIADEIQRSLGLKVSLERGSGDGRGGRLKVQFYSDDDLQMLFRRLVSE